MVLQTAMQWQQQNRDQNLISNSRASYGASDSLCGVSEPGWRPPGRENPHCLSSGCLHGMVSPSWRQPLRVDGPKASQRSIITYEIHFCIDQAKTQREVRFWFDLSYDATTVHGQMLRIKFCCFLFVSCRKVLPWDRVYKMARPKTRDT